jgi:Family of unknown function (DUF6191)
MTQWGLDTLFNPAKRHMDEEKRRLQSTREEVGDSSGGKRIDLDSGKVRIRRPGSAAATDDATDHDATDDDATDDGAAVDDATDDATDEEAPTDEAETGDAQTHSAATDEAETPGPDA